MRRPRIVSLLLVFATLFVSACSQNDADVVMNPDAPAVSNGLIAFPGRDSEGHQQVYTIKTDGSDRRQLTFENDNSMPSWSPDGARLVYVSRTPMPNLTIMDEDGGNKRTLVIGDAPDWGQNDQIAYAMGNPAEIWVVNVAGRTPHKVTSGDGHGGRVHPSWSPDGTRLVYMQLTHQNPADDDTSHGCPALPFRAELWIINADGTNPRLLTTPGSFNYDSNGQLINSANDANAPDWSAAGDIITFWSGQEQSYGQVWCINADGSERAQLTRAPIPSHNDDPAWSPDGTKVLFTTDRNGRPETMVMNADGSNPQFLTETAPGPGPGDAAWQPIRGLMDPSETASPPLREIIVSYADETNKLQLYRTNEDGSARRRITDGTHDCSMPAWSPDGRKIVYVQESENGTALWLSDSDGKNPKMLTSSGQNMVPSWLPDSKYIVWMALTPGKNPAESSQLIIMNTETLQSERLFSDPEQIKFGNLMPVVSPDGTKVAFVSNRSGNFRIWVSNLDGSGAKLVSQVSAELDENLQLPIEQKVPSWSPDGRWVAHWEGVEMDYMSQFTGKSDPQRDELIAGTWNVWIVGSDGKNKRKAGHGDDPTWSPDGFVTRSFPDPTKGGPNVMIETKDGWKELPIVPAKTPRYGRFTWKP
ncbi:MAG: LpqB family beta-propeller domain-containing protein [Candidatus Ozemobacteraceae bacterium]